MTRRGRPACGIAGSGMLLVGLLSILAWLPFLAVIYMVFR